MSSKVLVIGRTGNVGSEVAKELQAVGQPFKAAVRDVKQG
jgi:uncharacterized protein YbjT (DUF2867 family)